MISTEELIRTQSAKVFLCLHRDEDYKEVISILSANPNLEIIHLPDASPRIVTGRMLLNDNRGVFFDAFENEVVYDNTCPASLKLVLMGCRSRIVIGKQVWVGRELEIYSGINSVIDINEMCTFESAKIVSSCARVVIGRDCMFSRDIVVRNTDGHHIFDKNSGKRTNYSKDTIIGEHVWVGEGCAILKGVNIGEGSVLGTKAVVTKDVPMSCVVAGNPARVIKKDIQWDRKLTTLFDLDCIL